MFNNSGFGRRGLSSWQTELSSEVRPVPEFDGFDSLISITYHSPPYNCQAQLPIKLAATVAL